MKVYLGVDCGGTKTRCRLVDENEVILGEGAAGPGNLQTQGPARFLENARSAVQQALYDAGLEESAITAACFGIAGTGDPKRQLEAQDTIGRWLGPVCQSLTIETDAGIALAAAGAKGADVVLISGTGSICMWRDANGDVRRAGGHGWPKDEGSGAWLGARALKVATQETGSDDERFLKERLLKMLGAKDLSSLSASLDSAETAAALAPAVFEAAARGNTMANMLLGELIDCLANLASRAFDSGSNPGTLACVGGLFKNPGLLGTLGSVLESRFPGVVVLKEPVDPLDGACAIASAARKKS